MTLLFTATLASRNFDIEADVSTGETLAILGPNGAGKSTFLDLLAGLLRPDHGTATLAGRTLFDEAEFLAPHQRGISLLAQQALLFPHLSVLDNVAFGPRSTGKSARDARQIARHWLAEVDGLDLASRKPAELSGGQAQRIAIARALASEPALLLLDEPFAALDATVAPALRRLLRRVLAGRTVLLVTHNILDAMTLADRVLVMDNGRIVEEGPTRQVLQHPRTAFTAQLSGLNLLTGTRTATGITTDDGTPVFAAATNRAAVTTAVPVGTRAAVAIRPSAVTVSATPPPATPSPTTAAATATDLTVIAEPLQYLEPRGEVVRVHGRTLTADVPPEISVDLDLPPETILYFSFDASAATLYAATPLTPRGA
jgi:molybdate transport system ATP-binding protein